LRVGRVGDGAGEVSYGVVPAGGEDLVVHGLAYRLGLREVGGRLRKRQVARELSRA
jgi:hypothetical protein